MVKRCCLSGFESMPVLRTVVETSYNRWPRPQVCLSNHQYRDTVYMHFLLISTFETPLP